MKQITTLMRVALVIVLWMGMYEDVKSCFKYMPMPYAQDPAYPNRVYGEQEVEKLNKMDCQSDRMMDSSALLMVYEATNGAEWSNQNGWDQELPLIDWDGIVMSSDSCRVIRLDLRNNHLVGKLPIELGDLSGLVHLLLDSNQLMSLPSELENLNNLTSLSLDSNQLSSLPMALTLLSNLDTLHLAKNKLNFDIETIINDLSGITSLSYVPQAQIPIHLSTDTLSTSAGGTLEKNTYHWYNGDVLLESKKGDSTYVVATGGTYHCEITNDEVTKTDEDQHLILVTENIIVSDSVGIKEMDCAPQRKTDSLALVTLYYATTGNKWMDQTAWSFIEDMEDANRFPISEWLGITMNPDSCRVVGIDLSGNHLVGDLPTGIDSLSSLTHLLLSRNQIGSIQSTLGQLDSLQQLHLDSNQLMSLPPELGNLNRLEECYLHNNKLNFNIDTILAALGDISDLRYAPQATIPIGFLDQSMDRLFVSAGGNVENNTYQWYHNGMLLSPDVSGDSTYVATTPGFYYCKVTNDNITHPDNIHQNLILVSDSISVSIDDNTDNDNGFLTVVFTQECLDTSYALHIYTTGGIPPYTIEGFIGTSENRIDTNDIKYRQLLEFMVPNEKGWTFVVTDIAGNTFTVQQPYFTCNDTCIQSYGSIRLPIPTCSNPNDSLIIQLLPSHEEDNYQMDIDIRRGMPAYEIIISPIGKESHSETLTRDNIYSYPLSNPTVGFELEIKDGVVDGIYFQHQITHNTCIRRTKVQQISCNKSKKKEFSATLARDCSVVHGNQSDPSKWYYDAYVTIVGGVPPYTITGTNINESVSLPGNNTHRFSVRDSMGFKLDITDDIGNILHFDKSELPPCAEIGPNQSVITTQSICGRGVFDAEAAHAEIECTVSDTAHCYDAITHWFLDKELTEPYLFDTLQHSGADSCLPDSPKSLYAQFAFTYIDNFEEIRHTDKAGEVILNIYPEPQMPMVTTSTQDGNCLYSLTPICPDDQLSEPDFVVEAGDTANTYTITVLPTTENMDCIEKAFEIPYADCSGIPQIEVAWIIDCDTEPGQVGVSMVITGGVPPYEVSGTFMGMNITAGDSISIGTFLDGDNLSIIVSDQDSGEITADQTITCTCNAQAGVLKTLQETNSVASQPGSGFPIFCAGTPIAVRIETIFEEANYTDVLVVTAQDTIVALIETVMGSGLIESALPTGTYQLWVVNYRNTDVVLPVIGDSKQEFMGCLAFSNFLDFIVLPVLQLGATIQCPDGNEVTAVEVNIKGGLPTWMTIGSYQINYGTVGTTDSSVVYEGATVGATGSINLATNNLLVGDTLDLVVINDGISLCQSDTFQLIISETCSKLIATDNQDTIMVGTSITINLLGNDAGTGIIVTEIEENAHGSVNWESDGTFTYTPCAGFIGIDSIYYTIEDSMGNIATGLFTIVVEGDGVELAKIDMTQMICAEDSLDLGAAKAMIVGDDECTDWTITWFTDAALDSVYENIPIIHHEPKSCAAQTMVLYAQAIYIPTNEQFDGSTLTVTVYPKPQAPTINRANNQCLYIIEPACESDSLSRTQFTLVDGSPAGTRSITVTSRMNTNCAEKTFEVNYEACSSSDSLKVAINKDCSNAAETGAYSLTIAITGGVAPYSISGDLMGIVEADSIVTASFPDGEGYAFTVMDAAETVFEVDAMTIEPCVKTEITPIVNTQYFCAQGTPDLAVAEATLVCTNCAEWKIDWFQNANLSIPYFNTPIQHGGDHCTTRTTILYAKATLPTNEELAIGALTLIVYPKPQEPKINKLDDNCNYIIEPACENDLLSESEFSLTPGEPTGTRTIIVTSTIAETICATDTFEIAYAACSISQDCASEFSIDNSGTNDFTFCSNNTEFLEIDTFNLNPAWGEEAALVVLYELAEDGSLALNNKEFAPYEAISSGLSNWTTLPNHYYKMTNNTNELAITPSDLIRNKSCDIWSLEATLIPARIQVDGAGNIQILDYNNQCKTIPLNFIIFPEEMTTVKTTGSCQEPARVQLIAGGGTVCKTQTFDVPKDSCDETVPFSHTFKFEEIFNRQLPIGLNCFLEDLSTETTGFCDCACDISELTIGEIIINGCNEQNEYEVTIIPESSVGNTYRYSIDGGTPTVATYTYGTSLNIALPSDGASHIITLIDGDLADCVRKLPPILTQNCACTTKDVETYFTLNEIVCNADQTTYTLRFSWINGPYSDLTIADVSDHLVFASSDQNPQVDAAGSIRFIYNLTDDYNLQFNHPSVGCTLPIQGAAPICEDCIAAFKLDRDPNTYSCAGDALTFGIEVTEWNASPLPNEQLGWAIIYSLNNGTYSYERNLNLTTKLRYGQAGIDWMTLPESYLVGEEIGDISLPIGTFENETCEEWAFTAAIVPARFSQTNPPELITVDTAWAKVIGVFVFPSQDGFKLEVIDGDCETASRVQVKTSNNTVCYEEEIDHPCTATDFNYTALNLFSISALYIDCVDWSLEETIAASCDCSCENNAAFTIDQAETVCINTSIHFTNTSDIVKTDSSYWLLNSERQETGEKTIHWSYPFSESGTFEIALVTLSLLNDEPCRDTLRQTITVLPATASDCLPPCDWVLDLTNHTGNNIIYTDSPIEFSAITQPAINEGIHYKWSIDDIAVGSDDSTYTVSFFDYKPNYTIKVVATNTNSTDCPDLTDNIKVTVLAEPESAFNYGFKQKKQTISFINYSTTSDSNITYLWDFDDGQTSTQQHPIHRYKNKGSFKVCLTIEDTHFGNRTICNFILVN